MKSFRTFRFHSGPLTPEGNSVCFEIAVRGRRMGVAICQYLFLAFMLSMYKLTLRTMNKYRVLTRSEIDCESSLSFRKRKVFKHRFVSLFA